jgi:hypothetical protein
VCDTVTPIERSFDPARKRHYLVTMDSRRSTTDMEVLNEDAIVWGKEWWEKHNIRKFAGFNSEGTPDHYSISPGLPWFSEKLRIKVGLRNKPLDAYQISGNKYVSPRAKRLLESIDPGGFEFAECHTITRHNVELEPYWMMAVKRVIDQFDEDNSVYRERGGRNPEPVPPGTAMRITHLYDIRMLPGMPESDHAFYFLKYASLFVFDEALVDHWRLGKLNGFVFSPLQPPTKKELKSTAGWWNWEYHYDEMRHKWGDLI